MLVWGDIFNFSGRRPFTLECWFNSDFPIQDFPRLFGRERFSPTRDGYSLVIYKSIGVISFDRWVGGSGIGRPVGINYNVWNHAVATYNGSQMLLYVNGVASSPVSDDRSMPVFSQTFFIGAESTSGANFFNGLIDEARVYNEALTRAQIQSRYYAGLARLLAKNQITEQEYYQRLAINKF